MMESFMRQSLNNTITKQNCENEHSLNIMALDQTKQIGFHLNP